MTYPGGPIPGGTITGGDLAPLDGLSESAWRSSMDAKLNGYRDASHEFLNAQDAITAEIADARNQMLDMGDRVDLLESAPAYGQMFLSSSWNISGGGARKWLPFDTWLGPRKDVGAPSEFGFSGPDGIAINRTGASSGNLVGAGLWRADLQLNFDKPPSGWFGSLTVATIEAYLMVLGGSSGSEFYSERRFDLLVTSYGAQSAAFSTTFVIPDGDGLRHRVSAAVWHNRSSSIRLRGGTVDSCLSVNKWSLGTENAAQIDNPPDGGTL